MQMFVCIPFLNFGQTIMKKREIAMKVQHSYHITNAQVQHSSNCLELQQALMLQAATLSVIAVPSPVILHHLLLTIKRTLHTQVCLVQNDHTANQCTN